MGTPRVDLAGFADPLQGGGSFLLAGVGQAHPAEGRRMPMRPACSHVGCHSTSVCSAIRHPGPRTCAYAKVSRSSASHPCGPTAPALPCLAPGDPVRVS
jgi:hypothetical protein